MNLSPDGKDADNLPPASCTATKEDLLASLVHPFSSASAWECPGISPEEEVSWERGVWTSLLRLLPL